MSSTDFWRQIDIISPAELADLAITVIGVGGIGSFTVFALAKMGVPKITVYDHDVVEPHNRPNQLYRKSDIGKNKVDALREICEDFGDVAITACAERFEDQELSGVVISAVDSMKMREKIWQHIKWNPSVPLYVEARMSAEFMRIHFVHLNPCDPDDVRWYEGTLYPDVDDQPQACTAQAVIYNVFEIAGLIGRQIKWYVKGKPFPKEIIFDLVTLSLVTQ